MISAFIYYRNLFFSPAEQPSNTRAEQPSNNAAPRETELEATIRVDIKPVKTKEGLKALCEEYLRGEIRLQFNTNSSSPVNYTELEKTLEQRMTELNTYFEKENDIDLLQQYTIKQCTNRYILRESQRSNQPRSAPTSHHTHDFRNKFGHH